MIQLGVGPRTNEDLLGMAGQGACAGNTGVAVSSGVSASARKEEEHAKLQKNAKAEANTGGQGPNLRTARNHLLLSCPLQAQGRSRPPAHDEGRYVPKQEHDACLVLLFALARRATEREPNEQQRR